MFKNNAKVCAARAENIIKKDKKINRDDSLCEVIKSDFINILSNYVDVDESESDISMVMRGENHFELTFKINCVRVKKFFEGY